MFSKLLSVTGQGPVGDLRKPVRTMEQEKAQLKTATKEFEAFFKYYLLKTMRETIPDDPLTKDLPLGNANGKETFTDMFDMEVSRSGAGGKRSLAELMYKSMEKLVEARYHGKEALEQRASTPVRAIPLKAERAKVSISTERQPIQIIKPISSTSLPNRATKSSAPTVTRDRVLQTYQQHIDAAAAENQLDSTLIASVIHAESGGNPKAVSRAGAKGLMQLVDSTAQQYGATNTFDPEDNIKAGSRFLKHLMDRYQNVELALAAYNAGPGNVDRYGGIPPFKETKAYVAKVTALMNDATHTAADKTSKVATAQADKIDRHF